MNAADIQVKADQNPLETLSQYLQDDMKAVNALILQYMQSDVPMIPELASYLIAAGGKRIRPLLTLAGTSLFAGDMTRAHRLAACVEFIHTATLLHDDVVDDSEERRGKPSANTIFGNEASVLVGDFLFSRSFQLMVKDGNLDILRILSDASAIIAEGEVYQLSAQNNLDTTLDDYLKIIEGKTAALFAAACEVGPVIAGQDNQTVRAAREYGLALGMAFQVMDDILDYSADQAELGKTIGDDFREGKMSAPILYALKDANDEEYDFWKRTIADKNQKDEDFETAMTIIEKHDALGQGLKLAKTYAHNSKNALSFLPDTPMRSILSALADFVIDRRY